MCRHYAIVVGIQGKTTVARRMGKMYKALGLLATDDVKECSAKDLITGYVGQAGKKTLEILKDSRGGVLFIDEGSSRVLTELTRAVSRVHYIHNAHTSTGTSLLQHTN